MERRLIVFETLILLICLSATSCTGGELLECTTYVNSTGVDDGACLNGGLSHPCKTLGYVLTTLLVNTNCNATYIMISYDHTVFSYNSGYVDHTVSIGSSVRYLEINGKYHSLNFNKNGIYLNQSDNDTVIALKNIELAQCGWYACLSNTKRKGFPYYFIKQLILYNVIIRNYSTAISAQVQNVECYNLTFANNARNNCEDLFSNTGFQLFVSTANFSYNISHSSFRDTLTCSFSLITVFVSIQEAVGFVNIEHCHFTGLKLSDAQECSAIKLEPFHAMSSEVSIVVRDNVFDNNSYISFFSASLGSQGDKQVMGKVLFDSNYIINNEFDRSALSLTAECVPVNITNNTFIYNSGTLMEFYTWPLLHINSTTITYNTAANHFVWIKNLSPSLCQSPSTIRDMIISNNVLTNIVSADKGAIFIVQGKNPPIQLTIYNLSFTNNIGTPLSLNNTRITVAGNVTMDSNRNAVTGGALYVNGYTYIEIEQYAHIIMTNNSARYGGAIFIDYQLQNNCLFDESIILRNNTAMIGPSVYSSISWCDRECVNFTRDEVATVPTFVKIENAHSVFPGQPIVLNVKVTDCLGRNSPSVADVNVGKECDGEFSECQDISFKGPPTILLDSTSPVHTGLQLFSKKDLQNSVNATFYLVTVKTPITEFYLNSSEIIKVNIQLTKCPSGLSLNKELQMCQCGNHSYGRLISCSKNGIACVHKQYWYGTVDDGTAPTVGKCLNLFCNRSMKQCPISSSDYVQLSQSQDDQCLHGHGGPLCTACTKGKTATYGGLQCIPSHQCRPWHPYILLLLNILCPFVIGMVLIVIIQLKTSVGSGYLYGPLFYVAALDLCIIPFDKLKGIVKFFSATFLLKFQALGFIPWCFFNRVGLLYSTYFELIAPSVVGVILLLTIYIARCIPRRLKYFKKSPVHAICVLILILFWSLASTSIQIVTPVHLSGVNGARVNLKPDLAYLDGGHIPLWIVAVIILLTLSIVTVLLMVSPFVGLHRIKPILDSLQSCYKG